MGGGWARAAAAGAIALPLLATSCSDRTQTAEPDARRTACPATYRQPDPDRPRVTLRFDLVDAATVTGRETVRFTPDRMVDRLVFRLVPETPYSRGHGARLVVTSARVDGGFAQVRSDPADPSLLVVPLARIKGAGSTIETALDFRLTLPHAGADRFGHTDRTSWWGSGFPLLAWENGRGWATERAVDVLGEVATSEAADTDVTVTAPTSLTVLMSGRADTPREAPSRRRVWHAHLPAARDVSVAVGPFTTRRTTAGRTAVVVGTAPGVAATADRLLAETTASLAKLQHLFGPYPFDSLTVAALPGLARHGVEFPAAVQTGDEQLTAVVAHELAHQWFYALVGNDQARDPWLDEAFATYAQALLVPQTRDRIHGALSLPDAVGQPMSHWAGREEDYANTVYGKGADALLTARQRAGVSRFDAAIRCFVNTNAWRVATPDDLRRALESLPKATAALTEAGAFR